MGEVAPDLAFPGMTVEQSLAVLTDRAVRLQSAVQVNYDRCEVEALLAGLTMRQLKAVAIECAARANIAVSDAQQLGWMDGMSA